ncbi:MULTISPECIES: sulfotransferase [unclassified Imperialibacter]|uniref:sulfotransferase family protein n=1 Tax=unclassified Imperialibacter TaxID=2629706 RepID=UPI00125C83D0|nr:MULTISPECIES: sulfotransferase [unclassified Imperialibacter]CAD5259319.1 conserved hypothetical protein [Imperialibacter sp. 89]CAD5280149.1 conserved hypothetical protein [Imperialibacter sp. 75]VVT31833.1 conserved hypothetical protein [Imperialibacter sp. EC-SDR9]
MQLVFIVSQPRSGSTLLQRLLSNTSVVSTTPESWLLLPFLGFLKSGLNTCAYNSELALSAVHEFISNGIGKPSFRDKLAHFIEDVYQDSSSVGSKYFIDKTPRYYEVVDLIYEFFPTSKIILLKRSPIEVVSSMRSTWNIKNPFDLYPYRRDLLEAPLLIEEFKLSTEGSGRVHTQTYESLLENPIKVIGEIYAWLGLKEDLVNVDIVQHTSVFGKFGDPYSKEKDILNSKPLRQYRWEEETKHWRNFYRGYAHYLNSKTGLEYDLFGLELGKTKTFDDYLDFCELEIPDSKGFLSKNFFRSFWLKAKYQYRKGQNS